MNKTTQIKKELYDKVLSKDNTYIFDDIPKKIMRTLKDGSYQLFDFDVKEDHMLKHYSIRLTDEGNMIISYSDVTQGKDEYSIYTDSKLLEGAIDPEFIIFNILSRYPDIDLDTLCTILDEKFGIMINSQNNFIGVMPSIDDVLDCIRQYGNYTRSYLDTKER